MITPQHEQFARDIVAAARKNNVISVNVRFNCTLPGQFGTVLMSWEAGRHGAPGEIKLTGEAIKRIQE